MSQQQLSKEEGTLSVLYCIKIKYRYSILKQTGYTLNGGLDMVGCKLTNLTHESKNGGLKFYGIITGDNHTLHLSEGVT